MKFKLRNFIVGVLVFFGASLVFIPKTYAIQASLSYNPDDQYLTMWFKGDDFTTNIYGAWADCYPKEYYKTNNMENYKKFVLFYGTTELETYYDGTGVRENIKVANISDWATGTYVCDMKLNTFHRHNKEGSYEFTIAKGDFSNAHTYSKEVKINDRLGVGSSEDYVSFNMSKIEKKSGNAEIYIDGANSYFKASAIGDYKVYRKTDSDGMKYIYNIKVVDGSTQPNNKPATPTTPTTYGIIFDSNYGTGLTCDAGFTEKTTGVCEKTGISKGTVVNFPASSLSIVRDGKSLMGWTKELTNGQPNCHQSYITNEKTYTVQANTNFYACYEEKIGGDRFLQEGFLADGGNVTRKCGDAVWVDYCTKESDKDYCYFYESETNSYRKVYREKLSNTIEAAKNTCGKTSNETPGINTYKYATKTSGDYKCGEALYVTNCNDKECTYTKISKFDGYEVDKVGTISVTELKDEPLSKEEMKKCDNAETIEETKTCSNPPKHARKGTEDYTLCFDEKDKNNSTKLKSTLQNVFHCDTENNYYLVDNSIKAYNNLECTNGICTRTYSLTCKKKEFKPKLTVTSGIVQGSEKTGKITVKATATAGRTITDYYYSADYKVPTERNLEWTPVTSSTFTIESTPGVVYIWVMDDQGNISKAVTGVVIDTVNTDTTLENLTLYDSNNKLQTPESTMAFDTKNVKDSKYVMMSNDLSKDSNVIADAFNPYDMEYKLEVDSPTITVYATLTSTDSSYVDGYEPRTVNLDFGVNTVLIKIQNKEGKVRTYTILVTRKDNRTSDNTLKELSVSEGSINFNSNVTDYKVIIPKSTTNVEVKSTIGSNKASYVDGYKPGNVSITGDTTVKLIKVKSETGSTRTYVITFVKDGTDIITKESLQLSDLVIPDVYVPFEDEVANYSLTVDYEKDLIDINSVLKDVNSIVSISLKRKNDNNYSTVSDTGISLDEGENFIEIKIIDNENDVSYYRLTIIRKEFGLGISDDTALKELKVLGYDIKFKPDKKDYTVRIKQEKSLVITAVPNSNRAEVFIRGNDELTGFSTVRVKVVAENGKFETYSIDIKKDAFNKTIEIASIVAGVVIILVSSGIIIVKKKAKAKRDYFEE